MPRIRLEKAARITKVTAIAAKGELSVAIKLEQNAVERARVIRESMRHEVEIAQQGDIDTLVAESYIKWSLRAQYEHDKSVEFCRSAYRETQSKRSIFTEARKAEEIIKILIEKKKSEDDKMNRD